MRAAIVGLGAIAPTHFDAITRAGGEVIAVCDTDEGQAERLFEGTGCKAPLYRSLSEMLAAGGFDVLHICTPHYLHAEMVTCALAAGYHVLCEKPLCIREKDIPRILAMEKNSGKHLGVCLQNRYNAANIEARRLARDARAGFGTVVWERNAGYYASGAWRGRWETEGGGVMINQALHTLDLLQHICGMPTHVTSHISNDFHKDYIEVEDTAVAHFEREDGVRFHFYATNNATADLPAQLQFVTKDNKKVFATNNIITVDDQLVSVSDSTSAQNPHMVGKAVWGTGHAVLIADYYDCIREGKPFSIPGTEGAKVIQLILSMYHSHGNRIKTMG